MRKGICWLMLVGSLCMSFTSFTRSFLHVSENVEDFFKGFGIVLVISALIFMQRKKEQTFLCGTTYKLSKANETQDEK
jgi:ribose/xylose/arabinose/galactoside ABC-type transport system permease subunit